MNETRFLVFPGMFGLNASTNAVMFFFMRCLESHRCRWRNAENHSRMFIDELICLDIQEVAYIEHSPEILKCCGDMNLNGYVGLRNAVAGMILENGIK